MHIDSFFACSNSDLESADFVIFGIPYDATQSFKPGSRFAPNSIRVSSWNLESYSMVFDFDLDFAKICDAGNVNTDGNFKSVLRKTEEFLREIKDKTIVVLGGEHTITYAVLNGLKSKMDLDEICYVVFDAHFDLRDVFDDDRFNHACTTRRVYDLGIKKVVQIGVRSGTRDEVEFARKNGFKFYTPWDLKSDWIEEIREFVDGEKVYLSIDVDAFDPGFAPGVSTPEPFGLNPTVVIDFFKEISKDVFALDVVEVVPDSNGVTQMLASKIVLEFIASKSKHL